MHGDSNASGTNCAPGGIECQERRAFEERLAANCPCIKILIPFLEILHRRHHTTLPDDIVVPHVDRPGAARQRTVGRRASANGLVVIVVEM
jgi:hypothetical protein